jgi:hypothetical protein
MLKIEDIEKIVWDQTSEDTDDGDMLYEGNLTVHFKDGTVKIAYLDWVRGGHEDEFSDGLVESVIDYEKCYGEIEFD